MRVHELAKELNISSKELIDKANEALGLSLKSHSSTISDGSIDKIKALYVKSEKPTSKPKAFIVKKQKPVEVVEKKEEKTNEQVIKTVSRFEVVRSAKDSLVKNEPRKAPVQHKIEQRQQQVQKPDIRYRITPPS